MTASRFTQFGGTVYWDELGVSSAEQSGRPIPQRSQACVGKAQPRQGARRDCADGGARRSSARVSRKTALPEHNRRLREYLPHRSLRRHSRDSSIPSTAELKALDRAEERRSMPQIAGDLDHARSGEAARRLHHGARPIRQAWRESAARRSGRPAAARRSKENAPRDSISRTGSSRRSIRSPRA